jgi:hypothetical protein
MWESCFAACGNHSSRHRSVPFGSTYPFPHWRHRRPVPSHIAYCPPSARVPVSLSLVARRMLRVARCRSAHPSDRDARRRQARRPDQSSSGAWTAMGRADWGCVRARVRAATRIRTSRRTARLLSLRPWAAASVRSRHRRRPIAPRSVTRARPQQPVAHPKHNGMHFFVRSRRSPHRLCGLSARALPA